MCSLTKPSLLLQASWTIRYKYIFFKDFIICVYFPILIITFIMILLCFCVSHHAKSWCANNFAIICNYMQSFVHSLCKVKIILNFFSQFRNVLCCTFLPFCTFFSDHFKLTLTPLPTENLLLCFKSVALGKGFCCAFMLAVLYGK